MTDPNPNPVLASNPLSQDEVIRLNKIQSLVNELGELLAHGETIELWKKNGRAYCKVGYEEVDAIPVRCIAETTFMLSAVKAFCQAEAYKDGAIGDNEYFI